MNFNFGEVLSRAWQIIWKHKVLWIFGIFAGCSRGGGNGGGSGGGGEGGGFGTGDQPFAGVERVFEQLGRWIGDNTWVIVLLVILGILIVILSIFLGTIGRIGLILGTDKAEKGRESFSFGELFSESMPYFWRVFGLAFLIGLIFVLLFIPLVFFGVITAGIGFLCIIPLLCILIPLGIALSVVIEQANVAIVLENMGIGDGLRRGWEVVRTNPGPIIIMALILLIGAGIVGFVLALPLVLAIFGLVFGAAAIGDGATNLLWVALACCAVYIPVLLVLNGILTAYVQSAWALTYMRLSRPHDNAPVILEANAQDS